MSDTTTPQEPEDLIRYDILAQEALRSVVKKVLREVARTGLPGEHHFYITFDTNFSGVKMSTRMKDRYPEEMTIVVQHQFWDLETTDQGFSIGLSFDNIPEALSVPYASIKGFFDPSVQFGLQFDANEPEDEEVESESTGSAVSALPVAKSKSDDGDADQTDDEDTSDDSADENGSAEVVSLDAFRKK